MSATDTLTTATITLKTALLHEEETLRVLKELATGPFPEEAVEVHLQAFRRSNVRNAAIAACGNVPFLVSWAAGKAAEEAALAAAWSQDTSGFLAWAEAQGVDSFLAQCAPWKVKGGGLRRVGYFAPPLGDGPLYRHHRAEVTAYEDAVKAVAAARAEVTKALVALEAAKEPAPDGWRWLREWTPNGTKIVLLNWRSVNQGGGGSYPRTTWGTRPGGQKVVVDGEIRDQEWSREYPRR